MCMFKTKSKYGNVQYALPQSEERIYLPIKNNSRMSLLVVSVICFCI